MRRDVLEARTAIVANILFVFLPLEEKRRTDIANTVKMYSKIYYFHPFSRISPCQLFNDMMPPVLVVC
jgi:hypothetical protein